MWESLGSCCFFIYISTHGQESSVYSRNFVGIFFSESSTAACSSSFHLRKEKSRLIVCEFLLKCHCPTIGWKSEDNFYIRIKPLVQRSLNVQLRLAGALTCSRSPLAAEDVFPHLLFLSFPFPSS